MLGRSRWPRGLRRGSTAARLLRSWVRIPPRAWMSVCCECCVLSGRGLCDELITRPEESYRLWCVVCDVETTKILVNGEEAKAHEGAIAPRERKKYVLVLLMTDMYHSNTYRWHCCVSIATGVTRTRCDVRLYLQCLSGVRF